VLWEEYALQDVRVGKLSGLRVQLLLSLGFNVESLGFVWLNTSDNFPLIWMEIWSGFTDYVHCSRGNIIQSSICRFPEAARQVETFFFTVLDRAFYQPCGTTFVCSATVRVRYSLISSMC